MIGNRPTPWRPDAGHDPTDHRHARPGPAPGVLHVAARRRADDALLPEVEVLGRSATSGAHDMPWGQQVAHIEDPDGNVVNLTQQL